jgi:hypothetical protein
MTTYWGPLGWGTLHTIAALYPESPSEKEQQLVRNWFDSFAYCITCPKCQTHFTTMYTDYKNSHPEMFSSRKELTTFVFRAHNTVNRRLGKPVYTLDQSFALLQNRFPTIQSAQQVRREYLVYLQKDWGRQTTLQGINSLMRVRDLTMVEQQYWNSRSLDWESVRSELPSTLDITSPIAPMPARTASSLLSMPTVRATPQRVRVPQASKSLFSLISR